MPLAAAVRLVGVRRVVACEWVLEREVGRPLSGRDVIVGGVDSSVRFRARIVPDMLKIKNYYN